jgi:hypothetical protein
LSVSTRLVRFCMLVHRGAGVTINACDRKRERKKEKKMGTKNKARTWRPISRGSLVRANGIALEEFWNGCVEMKTANHGSEEKQEAKGEAGFWRVV